ncbi:MAG: 2-succinyl-5-enolpyruvyl-6-hydroxy-3-cyclohexene-1-carboxylic-acid synthase [Proteobacteria bacterium]|nr:2-succinyl-5-enolpyruvyl-6-hydroxy-3-cyclohexene-1-carboxylic-acid synthase [Pseudomonadota bacterium]
MTGQVPKFLPIRPAAAEQASHRGSQPSRDMPSPAAVQTAWARLFMDSLRRAGIRDAIISPGSRSTPFVLAAEHVGLRTHTIIDERSAGFAAVGYGRITGMPALLLCTSGTAGAHYYPAVIEAAQSFVPLVVVTADRPPEYRDCTAPQCIDQTRLFGPYARLFADLGPADPAPSSLRALARKAVQAVVRARDPVPGPVHINAPARKPLEPTRPDTPADIAMAERADELGRSVSPRVAHQPARAPDAVLAAVADACTQAERGVIVAGPIAALAAGPDGHRLARAVAALVRATGFPLLCEATSQLRFYRAEPDLPVVDGFDLLLASPAFRPAGRPDLILSLGAPPSSMSWPVYVAENLDCIHCVIAEHGWNDPHSSADLLIAADVADTAERLAGEVLSRSGQYRAQSGHRPWTSGLVAANRVVWSCVDQLLADHSDADNLNRSPGRASAMREGQAMRTVVEALPDGALLSLGNSLPIRTIDTYCRAGRNAFTVLSQRGANGIDGLISSAAGAAWAYQVQAPPRPVVAVMGDVTFAHDASGLAVAAQVRGPLVIVVIDNQGGRIFELLPIARADHGSNDQLFAEHWLTRPRCEFEALCAAYRIGYARAHSPSELADALEQGLLHCGCTVVHAVVAASSAAADRERAIVSITRVLTVSSQNPEPDDLSNFLAQGTGPARHCRHVQGHR